jgi:nitrite reductase/ring-hydroxylating ferredoxin subunit
MSEPGWFSKKNVIVMQKQRRLANIDFSELLLGGVIALICTAVVLAIGLYAMPAEPLSNPELQPAIRVAAESDFPIGSSRVRNWGDQAILVIRADSVRYFALEGTSPADDCLLRWDPDALRVTSPCSYEVYDLRGAVVSGLSTRSLKQYPVSIRDGVIYVSEGRR